MNIERQSFLVLFALCVAGNLYALEPLKESTEAYATIRAQQFMAGADKNGDGKVEAAEDAKTWARNKRHDANGDGAIDAEEASRIEAEYVTSSGKQIRDIIFKRTPGEDVYLDIYLPDVDDNRQKPVVLYTHGGGWAAGSRHGAGNASFNVVHTALLKKGFCVVSVGYRLVKKNGKTAMRDCVIDSMDALRFISAYSKELGVDPMRVYTFGDSAGGHLSQMVLLSPPGMLTGDPELAKYPYQTVAGVSWYGPCDFEDAQLFNHDDRPDFRDRFGPRILSKNSKSSKKLTLYREMSPINYVTKNSPPLLMIQGDKDTTIPVKHAYHMQKRAGNLNAPVEILIVKNAGHNWRSVDAPIEPSRDGIVKRTIQFFVKHSGSGSSSQ